MFVSRKYNFVFFEVPRTGSNSITQALAKLDPESPTVLERARTKSAIDYHNFHIPEDMLGSCKVFATHRNPYHRLWSFWKHRYYRGNPAIFRSTPWERYVKWVCEPSSVKEIKGALLDLPISEMFDLSLVSLWLNFESMQASWNALEEFLDVNLPQIGSSNASPYIGEFNDAYDEQIAARVAQRFAEDFVRFNYDTDSWKPS